ncbi:MAG: cytidylyltransferase domain-containing protein [Mycoplasmoidaceae bacterium]
MYKKWKILALIPARGGSKTIKYKNIRIVDKQPLIYYTIKAAKQCDFIDDIIVSTDSNRIARQAIKCGASVPFLRPANLATDISPTIDCVIYTINKLKSIGKKYDILILLQPTSPLRSSSDILNAFLLFIKNKQDLLSINQININPLLYRTKINDNLYRIINKSSTCRRQDLPTYYKVNGAIYINWIKTLTSSTSLNDNPIGYVMPSHASIDIDTMDDLNAVKRIIRQKNTARKKYE